MADSEEERGQGARAPGWGCSGGEGLSAYRRAMAGGGGRGVAGTEAGRSMDSDVGAQDLLNK